MGKCQANSLFHLIERGRDEAADALMNSLSPRIIALVEFFNEPGAYIEQILYFLTAEDCFTVIPYDNLTEAQKDLFDVIDF